MAINKALDDQKRSQEAWERGRGAPKKGNPRYKPKVITDKNGNKRKVYVLRNKKGNKSQTGNLLSDL